VIPVGLDVLATKDGHLVRDPELDALDVIGNFVTLVDDHTPEGASLIRGKAYEQFLADDNSLSLYEDLTPEQCGEVAAEFRAHAERMPKERPSQFEFAAGDVEEAARWFEVCSKKGYGTRAWY